MLSAEQVKQRRQQNYYNRIRNTVSTYVSTIHHIFRFAPVQAWSFEAILKYRSENVLDRENYQKLPVSEKRYLDGYFDALLKEFEIANLVWTHVLDGERFMYDEYDDACRARVNGRWHEISRSDLSANCFKYVCGTKTYYIPWREEQREAEVKRYPPLNDVLQIAKKSMPRNV